MGGSSEPPYLYLHLTIYLYTFQLYSKLINNMNSIKTILWKDIISELRTKELISSMAAFSIVLIVLFNFSLTITRENAVFIVPPLLWISIVFIGTLGLSRSFAIEKENSAITGVLLSPVDRSMLYFAKVLSNFIFIFIIQIILTALFIFLFNLSFKGSFFNLVIVYIVGGLGFSSLGTLFSTMAINTKLRELILPVILFPLLIPLLINAIKATEILFNGGIFGEIVPNIKILVCFDIIFLVSSALVYEYVVEDS
ncbi:MAG: heme exporter protein CcmB [Thermodesulfobacteriota bacterium]